VVRQLATGRAYEQQPMNSAATTLDSRKSSQKQELIAANSKLLIEQLEAGHSDALTAYLTNSRVRRYLPQSGSRTIGPVP
jgi:hypothetical protein